MFLENLLRCDIVFSISRFPNIWGEKSQWTINLNNLEKENNWKGVTPSPTSKPHIFFPLYWHKL